MALPRYYVEDLPQRTAQTFMLLQIKVVREETRHTSIYIDPLWEETRTRVALALLCRCVEDRAFPAGLARPIREEVVERTFVAGVVVDVRGG